MPSFNACLTSALLLLLSRRSLAFVPLHFDAASTTCLASTNRDIDMTSSRRNFLSNTIAATTAAVLSTTNTPVAWAAKDTMAEDKAKIVKGYERLNYLLDNWDKLTTFCGTERDPFSGKQVCEKTPLVVQEYMGYKSINDPLFKADKTLRRLEDLVPASKDSEYFDAVEKWAQVADEASGMAYTSSWAGPQNPNGGDDAIEYYLDRAKKQVVDAKDVLKTVITILEL